MAGGTYCILVVLLVLFLNLWSVESGPVKFTGSCHNCNAIDPNRKNVHIVPHSHDDVGWLETFDNYYYGAKGNQKNNIRLKESEHAGVQYIITTAVEALIANPARRFIQVETAFFWKWWNEQSNEIKKIVMNLINSGRLEIINGGWSMNDEAATHYQSIIDQFTWGFRVLNDTLGECARPKIGWQIDPFGHSREHASLLRQMGFKGLVLGRIDSADKKLRQGTKNLDFLWRTSNSLEDANIFTTVLPDFYTSLSGFCFDVTCYREDHIDKNNLQAKIQAFVKHIDEISKYYKTSNILVPFGGDFHFQEAVKTFDNLDILIGGLKGHPDYNVFYSTPSCYVDAVNEEINENSIQLDLKNLDFFPYGTDSSFWTGYFTSRPTAKRLERVANNILQAAKQLAVISRVLGEDKDEDLISLREALGVMQHHDAITGTAKQKVAEDYVKMLLRGVEKAENVVVDTILRILGADTSPIDLKLNLCLLGNVSICEASNKDNFLVAVYNPLAYHVTHYVRLPVNYTSYKIIGPDDEEIYDIFEATHDFSYVKEKITPSPQELVFAARQIPPLGVKLYYIQKSEEAEDNFASDDLGYKNVLEGKHYFGTETNGFTIIDGVLHSITINEHSLEISQEFMFYASESKFRPSGAYDFRPRAPEAFPIVGNVSKVVAKRGLLVDEVLQVFNQEVSQIIRVYKGLQEYCVEFDWLVGDLQLANVHSIHQEGKEVITRYKIKNFSNSGTFYTDSNGREMIERKLNFREDYEFDGRNNPIGANYYPITSEIMLIDEKNNLQVALLNDRAQGGTSLSEGEFEVMLNRRLTRDDGWGVGEVLYEREYGRGVYARGHHWLTFGNLKTDKEGTKSTQAIIKSLAHRKFLQPLVLVGDGEQLDQKNALLALQYDGLHRALPENVKLLTLEPWRDNYHLLRLEHVFEKVEDDFLSKPVAVDLNGLFTKLQIEEIGEMTLGANEWLDDYEVEEQISWFGFEDYKNSSSALDPSRPLLVVLEPMQIRTFLLVLSRK